MFNQKHTNSITNFSIHIRQTINHCDVDWGRSEVAKNSIDCLKWITQTHNMADFKLKYPDFRHFDYDGNIFDGMRRAFYIHSGINIQGVF